MSTFYHLTEPALWAEAQSAGSYGWSTRGRRIADVGYLHGSHAEQVEVVASAVYVDLLDELLVLTVDADPQRLAEHGLEVREEPGDPADPASALFPHLYGGELPVALVSHVTPYRRFATADRPD